MIVVKRFYYDCSPKAYSQPCQTSKEVFSQKVLLYMFDRVLNAPLHLSFFVPSLCSTSKNDINAPSRFKETDKLFCFPNQWIFFRVIKRIFKAF